MQPNGRGGGHLCMPPPTTAARIMRRSNTSDDGWCVREVGCDPSREPAIANVLAVANGTIGVRGWLDERGADCGPGTFFAGIFIPSDESTSDALPTIAAAPSWFALHLPLHGERLDTI